MSDAVRQNLLEFLTTASSCSCCMAGAYHDICIDHLSLASVDEGGEAIAAVHTVDNRLARSQLWSYLRIFARR